MSLEEKVEWVKDKYLETTVKLSNNSAYKYGVDVLSGWLYYTPTYAIQEAISGKDPETIVKTRLIGMATHALVMRPVGLLRNYVAKKWNVTDKSSLADKIKANFVGVSSIQAPVYAGMLIGGMAWSGNWNWEATAYAWALGVGIGALHSFPYGYVQDKVRKFFGVKPAIAEKEQPNNIQQV